MSKRAITTFRVYAGSEILAYRSRPEVTVVIHISIKLGNPMNSINSSQAAVERLAAQADAIGRLATDNGGFAAVVAAYEAADADAFRWALARLEQSPDCELICEWLRIKFCVIRCLEVCGPVRPD